MDYFEPIQAMHQEVRDFVERHHPYFRVTTIDGYATTTYQQTLASQEKPFTDEYILSEMQVRFKVSARSLLGQHLVCDVLVTSDGTLYLGDQLMGKLKKEYAVLETDEEVAEERESWDFDDYSDGYPDEST